MCLWYCVVPCEAAVKIWNEEQGLTPELHLWRTYIPAQKSIEEAINAFKNHWQNYYVEGYGQCPELSIFGLKNLPDEGQHAVEVRPQVIGGCHIAVKRGKRKRNGQDRQVLNLAKEHLVLVDVDGYPLTHVMLGA
jgi:hypothetical protein